MSKKKKKKIIKLLLIIILLVVSIFIGYKVFFKDTEQDNVVNQNNNTEVKEESKEDPNENESSSDDKENNEGEIKTETPSEEDNTTKPSIDKEEEKESNEPTILEQLQELSKENSKVNEVIAHYDDYPEEVLVSLTRNLEIIDFVLGYKSQFGNVTSDTIGNVEKGEIPLLIQWDSRWGYGKYGDSSMGVSGCGPTALAMVVAGLTGDNTMTPYKVAKFAENNGYYFSQTGTSWELMSNGAKSLGVNSKELPLDKNVMINTLNNGHPIICSMGKGDFTYTGHFIVLVGVENGKFKVHDPNSKIRSNQLWDYDRIKSQIKNLWEFYI